MPHTESRTFVAEHREPSTPRMAFTVVDGKVSKSHHGLKGHVSPSHAREQHQQPLPYWLVNVPREQWPETCPEWLRDTSEKNKGILATPDEKFQRLSWDEVKEIVRMFPPPLPSSHFVADDRILNDPIIGTNRIELFRRVPSELRRYLEYMHHIKQQYGSVMRFVLEKRLHWGDGETENVVPRGRPFEYDGRCKDQTMLRLSRLSGCRRREGFVQRLAIRPGTRDCSPSRLDQIRSG